MQSSIIISITLLILLLFFIMANKEKERKLKALSLEIEKIQIETSEEMELFKSKIHSSNTNTLNVINKKIKENNKTEKHEWMPEELYRISCNSLTLALIARHAIRLAMEGDENKHLTDKIDNDITSLFDEIMDMRDISIDKYKSHDKTSNKQKSIESELSNAINKINELESENEKLLINLNALKRERKLDILYSRFKSFTLSKPTDHLP